jgi:hypothetical protein
LRKTELEEFISNYTTETAQTFGYEDAIVGVSFRFGQEPIICYDFDKVIKILMKDAMTEEEAIEFFDYNVIGTWAGDGTPCFIKTYETYLKND